MKRILIIVAIMFCNAADAVECIQPRFARDALMELYLQQKYPEFSSELPILHRISVKAGEKASNEIAHLTGDVMICFMAGGNDCPNNKKLWSREDHRKNAWLTLEKYKDAMTIREKLFLFDQLDAYIQESSCSDF
jgi:hypothetical protein